MTAQSYESFYWQSERIRLRPMSRDDVDLWLTEEQHDSEAVRFLNYGMTLPKSEKDAQDFAERYADFNNSHERIMFSVETLDETLIGAMNIHSMDRKNGTFETGSRIYRAYRGKGYGFEAKILMLRYAFHELRLQKYNIRCVDTNEPMIRHTQRLGCQREGCIRRHIYMHGNYYSELIFGLTLEEFNQLLHRLHTDKSTHNNMEILFQHVGRKHRTCL